MVLLCRKCYGCIPLYLPLSSYYITLWSLVYHQPTISYLHVWGCIVYVRVPSPKKSEDRAVQGYFSASLRVVSSFAGLILHLNESSMHLQWNSMNTALLHPQLTIFFLVVAYYLLILLHPSTSLKYVTTSGTTLVWKLVFVLPIPC